MTWFHARRPQTDKPAGRLLLSVPLKLVILPRPDSDQQDPGRSARVQGALATSKHECHAKRGARLCRHSIIRWIQAGRDSSRCTALREPPPTGPLPIHPVSGYSQLSSPRAGQGDATRSHISHFIRENHKCLLVPISHCDLLPPWNYHARRLPLANRASRSSSFPSLASFIVRFNDRNLRHHPSSPRGTHDSYNCVCPPAAFPPPVPSFNSNNKPLKISRAVAPFPLLLAHLSKVKSHGDWLSRSHSFFVATGPTTFVHSFSAQTL